MNKNLITRTGAKVALHKSKSLINITKKILTSADIVPREIIEEWMMELWAWADENGIDDTVIPRDKNRLLSIEFLDLEGLNLATVSRQICFLENISTIDLSENSLTELPKEIINFSSLRYINLENNPLTLTHTQGIWLERLKNNGCCVRADNLQSQNLTTTKTTDIKKVANITDDPNRVIEFEDKIDAWIDRDTGLMWEVKTRENIKHMYVWSEEWVEEAYPSEYLTDNVKDAFSYAQKLNAQRAWSLKYLTDNVKDAFSYAQKLNAQRYGGFSDWRVPTKAELVTILTEEEINDFCIKSPLSKNSSDYYWSSTTFEGFKDYAWVAYFDGGYVFYGNKNDNYLVRCVRAGQ